MVVAWLPVIQKCQLIHIVFFVVRQPLLPDPGVHEQVAPAFFYITGMLSAVKVC